MTTNLRVIHNLTIGLALASAAFFAARSRAAETTSGATLETPVFHHVHLNSAHPNETIAEWLKTYPTNSKASLAGFDGFKTSNGIYFLVTKVKTQPAPALPDKITDKVPQTAFWHIVFPVTSLSAKLEEFRKDPQMASRILPLYTGPDGKSVQISSDAIPGFLTAKELEDAKAKGVQPTHDGSGYFTWAGPDGVILEAQNGGPNSERFSSFVLFQDQPYCAVLWYQKHLNAEGPQAGGRGGKKKAPEPERTEANCSISPGPDTSYVSTYKRGHNRVPPMMGVQFKGMQVRWYMNQEPKPLSPMRGGVVDHFGLSVPQLDPWIAKLQGEKVKFLKGPKPYMVGNMRAVMIEGPSKEAIELIELKN